MTPPETAIAVCGGGTGGHIFPALAVAQQVKKQAPEAVVYYFGREQGMEEEIVARHGLPFYGLRVQGFKRAFSWQNLVTGWQASQGFMKARFWLKKLRIQSALGTGGYVCGPVISAAASLGIPAIIHESNLVPGMANRLLSLGATQIAVCHPQTLDYFPENKTRVMGFPLREGINQPGRVQGAEVFGLSPEQKTLFVFPGSLAAHKINRAVAEMLPALQAQMPELQILWMAGHADLKMVQAAAADIRLRIAIHEFIHAVPEAYAAADLILARAGAGTIAELSATGKPALLAPYPYATDDHQTLNAAVLQKYGSADVIPDAEITGPALLAHVLKAFSRLDYMRDCGAVLQADYPKTAAQDLAKMLLEMAQKKK